MRGRAVVGRRIEHQQQRLPRPAGQQGRQERAPERADIDPLVAQPAVQAALAAGIGDRQGQARGDGAQADPARPEHAEHEQRQGPDLGDADSGRRATNSTVQVCNNRQRGDIGGLLCGQDRFDTVQCRKAVDVPLQTVGHRGPQGQGSAQVVEATGAEAPGAEGRRDQAPPCRRPSSFSPGCH